MRLKVRTISKTVNEKAWINEFLNKWIFFEAKNFAKLQKDRT